MSEVKYERKPMKTDQFIYFKDHFDAMEIAWRTGQNVILVGPKGHGKSEAIQAFYRSKGLDIHKDVHVQTFHAALTDSEMLGGLDYKAFQDAENPRYRFNVELSFANKKHAYLEEIFDAPLSTLAYFKDIWTSGQVRMGHETFPLMTQTVFSATNRKAEEVSEMGDTYSAILDRFLYIRDVVWPRYDAQDYHEMLSLSKALNNHSQVVARMAAVAMAEGHFVSPRTCFLANDAVGKIGNITPLKFIQGFQMVYEDAKRIEQEAEVRQRFYDVQSGIDSIFKKAENNASTIKIKIQALQKAQQSLNNLTVTNDLYNEKEQMDKKIAQTIQALEKKGYEMFMASA